MENFEQRLSEALDILPDENIFAHPPKPIINWKHIEKPKQELEYWRVMINGHDIRYVIADAGQVAGVDIDGEEFTTGVVDQKVIEELCDFSIVQRRI